MVASCPIRRRVWLRAALVGAALTLIMVGVALADDCSGPGDCASTTWFTNALNNGLVGTLLAGLGLTPIINLLFPGTRLPGISAAPSAPPTSGLPPLTAPDAMARLGRLSQFARRSGNPELTRILDRYGKSLVGPDGKVRQDQWDRLRQEVRSAVEKWSQSGEKPNSWIWDAGSSVIQAGAEFGRQVGGVIKDAAIWVGTKELEIADALLHPVDTLDSLKQTGKAVLVNTMNWMDQHIGREVAHQFQDAMKEGRYWDALKAFGRAEGRLISEVGKSLATEMLPVDEIKSFFDPSSDLETRLWAFPAAVTKLASLVTMSERLMTMPVPGIDKTLTMLPSAGKAAQMATQAESLAALGKLDGPVGEAARATMRVEGIAGKALAESGPITSYRQLQNIIRNNPELANAIDDAIRAGGDGSSLYKLAASSSMSRETHMLMTARKLELQEQAIANATRRIIAEEAAAIREAGGRVPGSYQTFNATQGSRINLNGANVRADLDQTLLGIKNVSPERAREILAEEVRKLGMDVKNLDTNIYVPKRGLADVTGDKPFSEDALRRILNQGTSESGRYHVYVGRDGQIHVSGPFKGQGADVLGPGSVYHDPSLRVKPSTPLESLTPQQVADRMQQMTSIDRYASSGEWDKVIKSANRASDLGAFDEPTRNLIRKLAHEKRPSELTQLMKGAGFESWDQLVGHLKRFGP